MNEITSIAQSIDNAKIKKQLKLLKGGTTLLMVVVFSVLGIIFGYYIFGGGLDGMLGEVVYAYTGESSMKVDFITREPVRTSLEYGTSAEILNELSINRTFETAHSTEIKGLLPNKTHVFRVVAEDRAGEIYKSEFFFVE